ncbi:hypothetical protein CLAFUW4_05849 [Fulvia fulva]|uniref:Uncharacterized protein n=1 Tax=Passalora fulva TaxID=5499 RepID=A0A9Q8LK76_PASFU|nr:uncharacterized protein CLAFUR5_05992 [Fulvia fulva]KAK4624307.1 hypothetical protein CLAFUR4_05843 [Fulvia fulva]KAK4625247.1 hypothetical protein CLAFUR0_05855 [Fulvia fulva]UJO18233.1 hypothetical protein CLAFUR5_05992 [Fulvia fulva]WPV14837.1 hypothetical protein CLAFUW4_05849 [Fulvia fulva]WPV30444.1 hypothetical protein CLAFUW7_05847 [Fulvia fulva]
MATVTTTRQPTTRRKKDQRSDIWSNLLRQTREAQARSRTQAVQHRELIVCGASPDDQRQLLQAITRPPPPQPPSRGNERRQQRPRGDLRLSNKYAYGYGHVTLYSPPQQSGSGIAALGSDAEEVARIELHTIPEAKDEYVATLRGLLQKPREAPNDHVEDQEAGSHVPQKPSVCLLLSWREPWKFLEQLRRWIQVLAKALLPEGQKATDPMDVVKDADIFISVVVQHTEAQEDLLKEGYKEDDFDYISQCLRSAILPLHPLSALVYTNTNTPPQQPGSALSEPQKVLCTSLNLDLVALSPKQQRSGDTPQKQELGPRHDFMDRMAIVIPAGWDSIAFIRTLSETFSPEDVLHGWYTDLQPSPDPTPQPSRKHSDDAKAEGQDSAQSNGGAEVYESSPVDGDDDELAETPLSPSKAPQSAVKKYESRILDPQAHKQQPPPRIEVTTKPDQEFLAEMRQHLQQLELKDQERDNNGRSAGVSNTGHSTGRNIGMPSGEQTGALNELGDVSFNVGGVSYDTISAEAAIERLKRPAQTLGSPISTIPRTGTPKPPRTNRETSDDVRGSETFTPVGRARDTSSAKSPDFDPNKLNDFFNSLAKKAGGGAGTRDNTPSKTG